MSEKHAVTLILTEDHRREVTLLVDEDTFILDAAAEAGIDLPHTCLQGWCLNCAGRLANGSADSSVDNRMALRYYPEDAEDGFVLLCTARPRSACRIATHQSKAMKAHRRRKGLPTPRG